MPALHIRNVSDELMVKLKVESANAKLTLHDYVLQKLDGNGTDHRPEELPRAEAIRAPEGREPVGPARMAATRRATGSACEHGTHRGFHCWQCGGLAKLG